MFQFSVTPGAKTDIRGLASSDRDAAALVVVTFQELQGNQVLLDTLTIHDHDDVLPLSGHPYNVKHVWEQYKKGKNLWRLKVMDSDKTLQPYRVIYGYSTGEQKYYVLGVVPRGHSYDSSHPTFRRILEEYSEYCE